MKISEWSEDAPRKAGSGAVSKALDRDDSSVGEGGCFPRASGYRGCQAIAST